MTRLLRDVLHDDGLRQSLIASGLETIEARHTCRHRVDELMGVLAEIGTARVTDHLLGEAAQ
jgi:spore maturation protein CgeB